MAQVIACGGEPATIVGTPNRGVIQALGGNDRIDGLGGNDTICSDAGNDVMFDDSGNDQFLGSDSAANNDRLDGSSGSSDSCLSDLDPEVSCEI